MFSFVRNHQTVFQDDCTTCIPTRNEWEFHIFTAFGIVRILDLAIIIGILWYLTFVLICNSLMTFDVEHLFVCLFAICISSLMRCLFRPFAHLKNQFVFNCSVLRVLCISDTSSLSDMFFCEAFFPSFYGVSFHPFDGVFHRAEMFNFNEVQLVNFFFHESCVWGCV